MICIKPLAISTFILIFLIFAGCGNPYDSNKLRKIEPGLSPASPIPPD